MQRTEPGFPIPPFIPDSLGTDEEMTNCCNRCSLTLEENPIPHSLQSDLDFYFLNVTAPKLLFLPNGHSGSASRRQYQQQMLNFSDQTFVVHKSFLHKTSFRASDYFLKSFKQPRTHFFSRFHSTNEILALA